MAKNNKTSCHSLSAPSLQGRAGGESESSDSRVRDYANVAYLESLYPTLTKVQQIDIDTIPSSKQQRMMRALTAYNAAKKRLQKAEETADHMLEKLEYEIESLFGGAEFALYTAFPEDWDKNLCITYGGYFLLRKKEVNRRVIDRTALKTMLGDQYDLCFKNETARGSLQTGIAIKSIIEKKLEKKPIES